jgi:hypothetical protein
VVVLGCKCWACRYVETRRHYVVGDRKRERRGDGKGIKGLDTEEIMRIDNRLR